MSLLPGAEGSFFFFCLPFADVFMDCRVNFRNNRVKKYPRLHLECPDYLPLMSYHNLTKINRDEEEFTL